MSSLFEVEVLAVEEKRVKLEITIVHPDQYTFPNSKTFVLMLLYSPITDWRLDKNENVISCSLKKAVDKDEVLDEKWLKEHAAGFVESLEIISTNNYPIPLPWEDEEAYDKFWEEEKRATAKYEVKATHAAWVEHLKPGMSWETASYDVGLAAFWNRQPRYPGDQVHVRAKTSKEGFAQGKDVCKDEELLKAAGEKEFLIALFGDSYYQAHDPTKSVSRDELSQLMFLPVVIEGCDGKVAVGTLIELEDEWLKIYVSYGHNCWGTRTHYFKDINSVGRAWYYPKAWKEKKAVEAKEVVFRELGGSLKVSMAWLTAGQKEALLHCLERLEVFSNAAYSSLQKEMPAEHELKKELLEESLNSLELWPPELFLELNNELDSLFNIVKMIEEDEDIAERATGFGELYDAIEKGRSGFDRVLKQLAKEIT